jgi:hypothetical protein
MATVPVFVSLVAVIVARPVPTAVTSPVVETRAIASVSAVSEGQSLFAERFRLAASSGQSDQAPGSAPAEADIMCKTADVNRSVAIILAVAGSVLVFWLVYRSLHRRLLRRA